MNMDMELYLTDDELKYELENTDGLEILEEKDRFYEVLDTFQGVTRTLRFNKEHNLSTNSIVELFNDTEDKYRIGEFLQMLPKILMMNVRRIYVVSSSEDLMELEEKVDSYGFDLWSKGFYSWNDGSLIVSVIPHEQDVEFLSDVDIDIDIHENIQIAIWKTLTLELFHALQSNPLFDGEIEQGEEVAEEFVQMFFQPSREVVIDSVERM